MMPVNVIKATLKLLKDLLNVLSATFIRENAFNFALRILLKMKNLNLVMILIMK